jgi:hypothetical protein
VNLGVLVFEAFLDFHSGSPMVIILLPGLQIENKLLLKRYLRDAITVMLKNLKITFNIQVALLPGSELKY